MLRISYTKHATNEEVLRILDTEKQLFSIIVKRKCQYFGHNVRRNLKDQWQTQQRKTKNYMDGQPKEVDRKIM